MAIPVILSNFIHYIRNPGLYDPAPAITGFYNAVKYMVYYYTHTTRLQFP